MSLKAFHIFFVTVSILLAFGFGVWGLNTYFQHTESAVNLWLGMASFLAGAILIFYGIKIFQKLQSL